MRLKFHKHEFQHFTYKNNLACECMKDLLIFFQSQSENTSYYDSPI